MECHRLVPLLLLLGLLAGAAATTGAEAQSCEPTTLATQIALFCAPDMPTAPCCEPVVASVDLGGGVPCLCRVAAQPQLVLARLNASHLLALYTACGGLRTGGAHLAAACQGPSPPAAAVIAPPPASPRRKQPTREAPPPPPPPPSEKPSPPSQQQPGGSVQGKAVPTRPATPSQLVPAAAPTPPRSGASGSNEGLCTFSTATLIIFFVTILILLE
ncbi:non-specific lipid-transfer protein EPAD1-like [Phragmites australis]|uniref:non-specific lipid-transfer protein EPAD1-like n=1 Tax=Phragmites australis TaxID=29695 RepID=UPI002D79E820|nr:non-specific lipid-transfer protein EPAD1-like [Phragmites australis]